MLLFYLLVVGSTVGAIAAGKPGVRMAVYVTIGVIGAFMGAFLAFGDAPFLMRYPLLNELTVSLVDWQLTVSLIMSVLLVTVARALERKVRRTEF